MAAMPVAAVPHLLNVSALAGYGLEVSCQAGRWRSLRRHHQEPEHKGGRSRDERTCPFHSLVLLLYGGAKPLRRQVLPP
jgi:hypothetical protein